MGLVATMERRPFKFMFNCLAIRITFLLLSQKSKYVNVSVTVKLHCRVYLGHFGDAIHVEPATFYFMEECCTDPKVMTFCRFMSTSICPCLLFVLGANMWLFLCGDVLLLSGFSITIFPFYFSKIRAPVAKQ